MIQTWQRILLRFLGMLAVQVFILNNIQINGYINPYLYIYFIILLPFETPGWLLLLSAFALGLGVDLFSGTTGMHATATVFLAFMRPGILRLISSTREYEPGINPSIRDLGFPWFFSYATMMVLTHHIAFFYIEVFRFSEFGLVFLRITFSGIFTLLLIIITQYLFMKKKKR